LIKLSRANLGKLDGGVAVPRYDPAKITPGILHFGVGNFHRAHLAVYLDDLFNQGLNHDWGIIGAGVMSFDEKIQAALAGQDYLSTIVEQDNDRSAARVIAPHVGFVPPADKAALLNQLADPQIRIVSLTITEGGYFINPATNAFDPQAPAIAQDGKTPDQPSTVFGFIVAGLKARRAKGLAPFTVMSCDNVPHNGVVTKNAVVGLARLSDPKLADWIAGNVAFPNAMVDRITPATGDRERKIAAEEFGVEDAWPVFCEEFKQWVLEDNFTSGRPAFEKAGATIAKDVTPYEYMKLRILNGGHAVIAYPGGLMDVHYVHEAMEHPLIKGFLDKVQVEEIIPTVGPVPNTNITDYYKLITRRFSNPKIGDTERRLCLDGSNRQPKFIVPVIADNLKAGRSIKGLALESALWCRYCYGETESGKLIEPNDPSWDRLQTLACKSKGDPLKWLTMDDIYGDVAKAPAFRESFAYWLDQLWRSNTAEVLKIFIAA
jgi:mannitol 2-dehydrogenase